MVFVAEPLKLLKLCFANSLDFERSDVNPYTLSNFPSPLLPTVVVELDTITI